MSEIKKIEAMDKRQIKFTFNRIKLIITGSLTILGLAGLSDNIVTWYSFLGDIVDVYLDMREVLGNWVFGWWPWGDIPDYVVDILILYGCMVFASRLLIVGFEEDMAYKRLGSLLHSIVLPIQLLCVILLLELGKRRNAKTGRWSTMEGLNDYRSLIDIRHLSKMYLKYLVYTLGAFVLLLFLNWQFLNPT